MPRRKADKPALFLELKTSLKEALGRTNFLVDGEQLKCSIRESMDTGKKFIGYLRVSTRAQGESGLGLEAQQKAVGDYVANAAGKLIATYTETESGKKDNRPELVKALAHAKRSNAILLVARLDRLSRNATFLSALLDSGVDFVACDNPIANKLTIRILAAVAQEERELISKRTREALQAAKARGVKLGSNREGHWNAGNDEKRMAALAKARPAGRKVMQAKAREGYQDLLPVIQELHKAGESNAAIARQLTEQGHTTRGGKQFTHVQVARILKREGAGK